MSQWILYPAPHKDTAGLLNRVLHSASRWLPKVEKVHMTHAVEGRMPFTDLDLVRFACGLPQACKLRDFKEKYVLRMAVIPLLPREVLAAKMFPQATNYNLQLSEALDTLAAEVLSRAGACPGLLRPRRDRGPAPGKL